MTKYNVERWTGKAWYKSLESPFKSMTEVRAHLTKYAWHYTDNNPYRITEHKPKKTKKYTITRSSYQDWYSDKGMVVKI